MSEIKGSLLTIVLAVAVFGIVFGIIMASIKTNSTTIAGRMKDAAEIEPILTEVVGTPKASATLNYHF